MKVYKEKKRKIYVGTVTGIVELEDSDGTEYQGDLILTYGKTKRTICSEGMYCPETSQVIEKATYGDVVTFEKELHGLDGFKAVNLSFKEIKGE